MKSSEPARSILRLFLAVTAAFFCVAIGVSAEARLCASLFRESEAPVARTLIDPTWIHIAEHDYATMLVELGMVTKPGEPLPEHNAGTLIYSYFARHPAIEDMFSKIGFTRVENPLEPARYDFPATFAELVKNVESASPDGTFKVATYNVGRWYRLDLRKPQGATTEVANDLPFLVYANMVANGYTPMWPGRSSLGLLHALAHVTEYIEHPDVFPTLQRFFRHILAENTPLNSNNVVQIRYAQRANFFNEASYILKPEKYQMVDSLIVTESGHRGSLSGHVASITQALKSNSNETLVKIRHLTNAFDEIFFRHGGGARDVFAVDTRLSHAIIEAYVDATRRNPTQSTSTTAFPAGYLAEFIESPEGIKRQIQYIASRLQNRDATERASEDTSDLQNLFAYRVAQLEMVLLTQRRLELSQVDIIEDSMLPLGANSKTSQYFQAYLPPTAKLHQLYVATVESRVQSAPSSRR